MSLASHCRLQARAIGEQGRIHEVSQRALTQWGCQAVDLAVTATAHVLQDLCKLEKEDDGAGLFSGGNAV